LQAIEITIAPGLSKNPLPHYSEVLFSLYCKKMKGRNSLREDMSFFGRELICDRPCVIFHDSHPAPKTD